MYKNKLFLPHLVPASQIYWILDISFFTSHIQQLLKSLPSLILGTMTVFPTILSKSCMSVAFLIASPGAVPPLCQLPEELAVKEAMAC